MEPFDERIKTYDDQGGASLVKRAGTLALEHAVDDKKWVARSTGAGFIAKLNTSLCEFEGILQALPVRTSSQIRGPCKPTVAAASTPPAAPPAIKDTMGGVWAS